ncbi:vitamin K epoxide reductase family protein [Patescibacteria group bacterium]|jgi:uncharacterized membrane protein|nr:vitamin K epoxide reductase family protein [Patescibacteria group bacterium]
MKLKPPHARIIMGAFALVGAFASAYLLHVYITGGPIVCGSGDVQGGCDAVRASRWAYVLDIIPRPALGLGFYASFFLLLCLRASTAKYADRLRQLTWVLAAVGALESIYLFLIQAVAIKAYCIWCLTSTVCCLFIAGLAFFDRKEQIHSMQPFRELRAYLWMFLIYAPIASILFWALTVKP